jgi:hypothetical protein
VDDPVAGVRFTVPFPVYERKTASQVEALVRERPQTQVPEGAVFTSGVYGPQGLPYVIVWTKEAPDPTRDQLATLASASEGRSRFGLASWTFDPETMRGTGMLHATGNTVLSAGGRILVQLVKGGVVGVAYFDAAGNEGDAAAFAALAASLTVAPEKRIGPADLPRGPLVFWRLGTMALVLAAAAGALALRHRRSQPARLPDVPDGEALVELKRPP